MQMCQQQQQQGPVCTSALLQVTISSLSGDTLKTVEFKGDPLQLCSAMCKDERPGSAKAKVGPLTQIQHPFLQPLQLNNSVSCSSLLPSQHPVCRSRAPL
jgi:hypothetical protein